MVPEAALEQTETGVVPASGGWFVQEDFLVLYGEALLIVEGQERAVGGRDHIELDRNGGAYTVDEVALRHGAGVEEETSDPELAYARFPETEHTRYREGWLPA